MKKNLVFCTIIVISFLTIIDFNVYARTHEANFDDLGDYYSTQKACSNDDQTECKERAEYKFYLKMYDIYYLYKNKYKVKLDLPLLMATLFYNKSTLPEVFQYNLSDYDRKVIVDSKWNPSETTPLDWDYDYESQYNYLASNDFSMDMQILAKNMVAKITTQKCVKDGETIKTKDIKDYEEDLKCGDGETLEKGDSTYKLDLDKYDDFLLNYIEHKYFLNTAVDNPVRSNGQDSYIVGNIGSSDGNSSSASNEPLSPSGIAKVDNLSKIALGEVGNGGSKYRTYMFGSDNGADWCGPFVSWLFSNDDSINIVKSGGAGSIPRESIAKGYGTWLEDECTDPSSVPRAGDVILFDPWVGTYMPYPKNGNDKYYSSHVGYIYKVDDEKVYTVEGNSGNQVSKREYSRKTHCGKVGLQGINGYFRPNY